MPTFRRRRMPAARGSAAGLSIERRRIPMSTVTYDVASAGKRANARQGWFARFFDRLIKARERQAADVIRRHRHLLPHELEEAGWKLGERSEDSLPFTR